MKFVLALIASTTAINLTRYTPNVDDDTTHKYSINVNTHHADDMQKAADIESIRQAAIDHQAEKDVWRKSAA